ncbi:MAG TPA: hypothetical protein VIH88_03930 [Candidatus Acidoferrales bacterium]
MRLPSVEADHRRPGHTFQAIALALLACWPASAISTSRQPREVQQPSNYNLYELYSWQGSRAREWNFCILYNTSREKTVKEVLNKKTAIRGLDELKKKISDLPPGSKIIWRDELIVDGHRQKGSEKLAYPPEDVVQEVRHVARAHDIEMPGNVP